jgi:hypothetical protein
MSVWILSDAVGQAINSQTINFFVGKWIIYFAILECVPLVFSLIFIKINAQH